MVSYLYKMIYCDQIENLVYKISSCTQTAILSSYFKNNLNTVVVERLGKLSINPKLIEVCTTP